MFSIFVYSVNWYINVYNINAIHKISVKSSNLSIIVSVSYCSIPSLLSFLLIISLTLTSFSSHPCIFFSFSLLLVFGFVFPPILPILPMYIFLSSQLHLPLSYFMLPLSLSILNQSLFQFFVILFSFFIFCQFFFFVFLFFLIFCRSFFHFMSFFLIFFCLLFYTVFFVIIIMNILRLSWLCLFLVFLSLFVLGMFLLLLSSNCHSSRCTF